MRKTIIPGIIAAVIITGALFMTIKQKRSNVETEFDMAAPLHKVIVEEVKQTSSNTYLKVAEGHLSFWIAVVRQEAAVGETYFFNEVLETKDFVSKELDTTFSTVYFIRELLKEPGQNNLILDVPSGSMKKPAEFRDDISVQPSEDGKTIAQIFSKREEWNGKTVKVKGQVVKVNPAVMGKNWVHIQDGTESDGNFDLTITTLEETTVGQIVEFAGMLSVNRDFGAGYIYQVIIEDASIVK